MNRLRDIAPPDPDVSGSLAVRYSKRLLVFALRRLGDRESAEDAAQETLRRVVEALDRGQVRDVAAMPGFVFQTAKHVCHQMLRRRAQARKSLARLANEPPVVLSSVLNELLTEERRRSVREALEALPPDDAQMLELFYHRGLSTNEIADRLGIRPGAVRVRKHRALQRLAKLLRDDETFRPPQQLKRV